MRLEYIIKFTVEVDRAEAIRSYGSLDFKRNPNTIAADIVKIEEDNIKDWGIDSIFDLALDDSVEISIKATEVPSETN